MTVARLCRSVYLVNIDLTKKHTEELSMTVLEIQKALKDRRLKVVSQATGLHVNTIRKVRDGMTTDPRSTSFILLSEYLEANK